MTKRSDHPESVQMINKKWLLSNMAKSLEHMLQKPILAIYKFVYCSALLALSLWSCQSAAIKTEKIEDESFRNSVAKIIGYEHRPLDKFEIASEGSNDAFEKFRIEAKNILGNSLPMYLLKPKQIEPPHRVMICLQGHAPGMYISLGEVRTERDKKLVAGGRDLAMQAIKHGWAALTVEQYGFGEQAVDSLSCNHLSLNMTMRGRSMIGRRASDFSTAIDFIETQSDLTLDGLGCMGNSSGGTTTYFASAMDERIQLSVVSCSFSTYESSWLRYPHCACGYVPGLLEIADMPELARLIAPRKLIIVAGKKDYLADIDGVRTGFEIAKQYYKGENDAKNIVLIEGEGGHQFYPEQAWPVVNSIR